MQAITNATASESRMNGARTSIKPAATNSPMPPHATPSALAGLSRASQ